MKPEKLAYYAHRTALRLLHAEKAACAKIMPADLVAKIFYTPGGLDYSARQRTAKEIPDNLGGVALVDDILSISDRRTRVRIYRSSARSRTVASYGDKANEAQTLARNMMGALRAGITDKRYLAPSITCELGVQSRISTDSPPRAYLRLPIHWTRTVHSQGIAVCDWIIGKEGSKVFVVRARAKTSAFLADMGLRYYEVDGLRLGRADKFVTGYAFMGAGCKAVFSPTFRAGVEHIKARAAEAALKAME